MHTPSIHSSPTDSYPSFLRSSSHTDEYPEHTWGLKLGDMKEAIKRGHSYKDHRDELLEMGFVFDRKKHMTGWPRLKGMSSVCPPVSLPTFASSSSSCTPCVL